jgi:tetratricopeptide (TPR) repeat protein
MIAECLFRQERYPQAWEAYQAALAQPPSTPLMQALLMLHAAQSASQLKQWSDSIRLLSGLIEQPPEDSLLAQAYYERGWARQQLGQTEPALEDYEQAATRSREEVGARARFMRGELLFADKRHELAIRDFMRVMYGFGGDQAPPAVRNWQAKSGFEAGRCAEVLLGKASDAVARQKHLADARKFYSFVVEKHAQHELASQARKRLDELNRTR